MRDFFKKYLFPIYKVIIDFFELKPKTKYYRYFVKLLCNIDENSYKYNSYLFIIFLQFALWHWMFDFTIFDDLMSILIAFVLYPFINKLILSIEFKKIR